MGASLAYDLKGLFLQAMALIDQKPWIWFGAVIGCERRRVRAIRVEERP
jgi:hypothetical protein